MSLIFLLLLLLLLLLLCVVFGATPSTFQFGAPAQTAGGFGAPTSTSGFGGAFGAPAGATGTTAPSTLGQGGLYGAPPPYSGSLFGQQTTQTQQTAPTGLFGASAATHFGAQQAPAQQQQQQAAYGATGFGVASSLGGMGTAAAKYQPTAQAEGAAQVLFFTISAMQPYNTKSVEELRLEDYTQNRKGISGATATAPTSLFGPTTTPGFGAAPAAAATPGFGAGGFGGMTATTAAAPAFGGFGATTGGFGATTGAFGAPATAATPAAAGGFGGFGQTATTAAAPTFGRLPNPGGAFSMTAGQFGQPAPAATAPGFGGFGATAATPAASTFGGFGQPATAAPAATTGLFGASTATPAPATAFGFGALGPTAAAAAPAATTAGMFGGFGTPFSATGAAQPLTGAAPAFAGFGATPTKPAAAPAPGFGFGQPLAPATTFAAPAPAAAAPFSLGFMGASQAPSTAPAPYSSSGFSSGFSSFGLGGGLAQPVPTSTSLAPAPTLLMSIDAGPYGFPDLLGPLSRDLRSDRSADTIQSSAIGGEGDKDKDRRRLYPVAHFKVAPRSAIKTKPRFPQKGPAYTSLLEGAAGSVSLEPGFRTEMFVPRRSVKKLEISGMDPEEPDQRNPVLRKAPMFPDTPGLDYSSTATASAAPASDHSPSTASRNVAPQWTPLSVDLLNSRENADPRRSPARKMLMVSNADYYTVPSLDKLRELPAAELKRVRNFEIGCSLGSVAFDLADLSAEGDLCRTVIFTDKAVTLYPDDSIRPARGTGLNQPAVIRLSGTYTLDKDTGRAITDPNDPRVQKKIHKMKNIKDTNFIQTTP